MRNLNKKNGKTRIVLIITIIVLLIFEGVSISMLAGNSGIIIQDNKAKKEQSHEAVKEGILLA